MALLLILPMKKLSQNMQIENLDKKLFYESLNNKEYEVVAVPYHLERPIFHDLFKQFECVELKVERSGELWRHIVLVPVYYSQQLQKEIAKRSEIEKEQIVSKPRLLSFKYVGAIILIIILIIIFVLNYVKD